jgi:glycosyltransferase involved in cell wall biosynthesis
MTSPLLVLAEGDPETLDSWSGSTLHLVQALRRRGYDVRGSDVTERGVARVAAVVSTFSPHRRRWAARYHFGPAAFAARSRRARHAVRAGGAQWDGIIQIGATFDSTSASAAPTFVYCDSNAHVAAANRPYGDVAQLSPVEFGRMVGRETTVYGRAAHVFTMSELVRRSFLEDFRLSPDKVTTVYAGANLDPSTCVPRAASLAGPPTILFVGRHWEAKGGPVLLEAFLRARSVHSDLRLVIAGCSPPLGEIPGVEVLGPVDKGAPGGAERILGLYRGADLFCMPSRFDAFGIVFVEAMLHAVPCVGSRHAAMPEIVTHGKTGWLVSVGDVPELQKCLVDAFRDRAALARMGQRGRERALELFTWDSVAGRMHRVMQSPVGKP